MSKSHHAGSQGDSLVQAIREFLEPTAYPVPLHEPFIPEKAWSRVKDCLDTGWVSSVGSYVTEFEEQFKQYTGAQGAVAMINGTSALHMALLAIGVERGDEVLLPSLTFVATANAVSYCGAKPHFIDVDRDRLGLCSSALRQRLHAIAERRKGGLYNRNTGARIKAVIGMHTFGHPVALDNLLEVCTQYDLPLIEDSAESLGSSYKGRPTGTFGQCGVFSFNGNKTVTAGTGGMLITADPELEKLIRHLSTTAKQPHPWQYWHDQVGYNYRLSNLNAAVGCAGMEQLDTILEAKRTLAALYHNQLSEHELGRTLREPEDSTSNYWLNVFMLHQADLSLRDAILTSAHEAGILLRPCWVPLHELPMFEDCEKGELTSTKELYARIICLPSSPSIGQQLLTSSAL